MWGAGVEVEDLDAKLRSRTDASVVLSVTLSSASVQSGSDAYSTLLYMT